MSKYITVVIKFDKEQTQPTFRAHMGCLGGVVDSVGFYDALVKLEEVENALEECQQNE